MLSFKELIDAMSSYGIKNEEGISSAMQFDEIEVFKKALRDEPALTDTNDKIVIEDLARLFLDQQQD